MKHPILASILPPLALGQIITIRILIGNWSWYSYGDLLESILFYPIFGGLLAAFVFYPIILSVINVVGTFVPAKNNAERIVHRKFEMITLVLGVLYSFLFIGFSEIYTDAEWHEQLVNAQVHQPLWSGAKLTVFVLCIVGVAGYLILSAIKLERLSPIIVVLSISAMYLGILECILWSIQTMSIEYWVLSVLPVNCILIVVKTIRYKIWEWNQMERHQGDAYSEKPVLNFLNNLLGKAEFWPVLAFILMWPLLGILLCILMLFGQKPDAFIKAWTETADWRLSAQTAPQNVMYDEHYLCTVAAGGHERLVKPLRMGERHGHRVVVNRQLCVANAFEQILEERTPRFHRAVRRFYDTYGFPVARLIRTKGAADMVYLIMKPLEWIFLFVLYLCDVNPENRIAVQYLPKRAK